MGRRGGAPVGGGGGGSGGSGGGGVPASPGAGLLLTSTGAGPASTNSSWQPAGGFSITSFSGAATIEVGDAAHAAVTNPPFTASYSETPTAANITNSDGIDSPHNLVTPFTAGTVTGVFGPKANNASTVFTLHATFGTTLTRTSTKLWSNPILAGVDLVANVAATQGFLDSLAAQIRQLHTANAGTYVLNATAGKICCLAIPSAYAAPTFFLNGGTNPTTPALVGTFTWDNGRGSIPTPFTIPMSLWTVGLASIGACSWVLQ